MKQIKASELRIGNFVQTRQTKDNSYYYITDFITIKMSNNYTPIPLTEEWLLKFGFIKNFSNCELLMQKARLCFIYYGGLAHQLDIIQDSKHLSMSSNCTLYVHQLQNLYFALTGEELVFILNK